MNRPGNQLFTSSRFSLNDDSEVRGRYKRHLRDYPEPPASLGPIVS